MKTRYKNHFLSAGLIGIMTFSSLSLCASTIFWGTRYLDTLVDSSGANLDSSFAFELGTFETGFTPNSSNITDWASKWMVFDAALFNDGWDASATFVNASAEHLTTGGSSSSDAVSTDVFTQGSQVYLWVFNSKIAAETSQWALLLDNDRAANEFGNAPGALYNAWEIPDPLDALGSFDWQTRDLDTALFGGVNNVQGPGIYSANPASFTIQTHAVPEPGSAIFIFIAGAAFLRRRHSSSVPF